jgi:signal transduction histidine kinase/CheY-like chemotaxis protein
MRTPSLARLLLLFLTLAFAVVLAVALALLQRIAVFPGEADRLGANLEGSLKLSQRLHEAVHRQDALLQEQMIELDPAFLGRFLAINHEVGDLQVDYLRLDLDADERLAVERIKAAQAELGVMGLEVNDHLLSGRRDGALRRMSDIDRLAARIDGEFQGIEGHQLGKLRGVLVNLQAVLAGSKTALLLVSGVVILVLATVALLLRRRILAPLKELLAAQNAVRQGDFSARAAVGRRDEIGRLAQGFNFMAESLAQSYAVLEHKVEERTREVRALQEQVVQAAKMSALGRLVSGVAHELNNPLTVIVGYGELLRGELGAGDDRSEMADAVLEQAERCRSIVRGLAQFARPQEGERQPVRLARLAERVLALREYELRNRNIELVRDYDPGEPQIAADPHKLEQLVLNLLNNACDAIDEARGSGTIWVRTRGYDGQVTLEICDTGTGIREPGKVFEPFYTTKEVGKGIGMGLAVCYGIVQQHGGQITAENWERGARFLVTLPIGDPAAPAAAGTEEAAAAPAAPAAVLLVEDEDAVRRLQASFLQRLGLEVSAVASGREAIQLLEQRPVDLVVSDVRMPGPVSGSDLYRWVAEHRPALCRRFVFVTGDPSGSGGVDLTLPSEVPCIQKPFSLATYTQAVRSVLDSGSAPR